MVRCGEEHILRRPFSIHQIDNSNQLFILFEVIGKGTKWLAQRSNGEKTDLLGPLGNSFQVEEASKNLVMVAGGIGIAPLVFLAQRELMKGKTVKFLMGARTKDRLYPQVGLPSTIEVETTTEDGSSGRKGMVTDIITDYIDWADQIFACGPTAMYQTISHQMQQRLENKTVQVSLEVRLGCGLGACFGCSIKTKQGMKQVCRDGPIFNLSEVILPEVKV